MMNLKIKEMMKKQGKSGHYTDKALAKAGMEKPFEKNSPGYYFHADEDFREDWDWVKQKRIASKTISKSTNKFEI